ncbi:MAG: diaminopimelate epimerase [Verrucomicrobiota bacterium]
MQFRKYHGLGNDYLVIEPETVEATLSEAAIRDICDRHCGVGSDGILFGPLPDTPEAFPDPASSAEALPEFAVRIFNPDGSEAEKSGNGLRIFARHLHDTGRVSPAQAFLVRTLGGPARAVVEDPRTRIRVQMGRIRFDSDLVPVAGPSREVIDEPYEVGGETFRACAATVGNPHCILLVDDPTEELARRIGPLIETDERFPRRTNVQFMTVRDTHSIRIEIWERGAGYTLASGSSASACAAAACRLGLCGSPVTVYMPGGELEITLDSDLNAELVGPVACICKGTLCSEHPALSPGPGTASAPSI